MTAGSAAACQPPDQAGGGSSVEPLVGASDSLKGAPLGPLRCISYLSPSLPYELFQTVADYLASSLGFSSGSLQYETRFSAPPAEEVDPFALDEADLGFVCSTAVPRCHALDAGFELLGCAHLFDHPKAQGRPVYFSDVVVSQDSTMRSAEDLGGRVWAYNDSSSLSGMYCLLQFLRQQGRGLDFLKELRPSGSHLRSLELVLSGSADAAAIDSTVLALQLRKKPELQARLRVIASWGPFPAQPLIVRRTLPEPVKLAIRRALSDMPNAAQWRRGLGQFHLLGFAPIDEAFYADEQREIEDCQRAFGHALTCLDG